MDAGAAARAQYSDRMFDKGPPPVGQERLGAPTEPPPAAGRQQQPGHLVFVLRHVPCIPDPAGARSGTRVELTMSVG